MAKRLVEEIKGDNIMTNREKAIACFAEWLKSLDNKTLAHVLIYSDDDMSCQHCMYNDEYNHCCNDYRDSCRNGIKKWLEQE